MDQEFNQFKALLKGPINTPYESGKFELLITLPQNYPHEPSEMKFVTKIFHPNISDASGLT